MKQRVSFEISFECLSSSLDSIDLSIHTRKYSSQFWEQRLFYFKYLKMHNNGKVR